MWLVRYWFCVCFRQRSGWVAPPRTSGTFTTVWPKRRAGERGAPSSCCSWTTSLTCSQVRRLRHAYIHVLVHGRIDQTLQLNTFVVFDEVNGRSLYEMLVKVLDKEKLHRWHSDTPWRAHLGLGDDVKPERRALYKPPLVICSGGFYMA